MMLIDQVLENKLISMIINGDIPAGTMLESERVLAEKYGVSRPVVHRAMLRLESKGLVTIMPRKGIWVNDYQKSARLSLLETIIDLDRQAINPQLNRYMFEFVEQTFLFLVLNVSASYTPTSIKYDSVDPKAIYRWVQQYALANGNPVYTMLLNEFEVGIVNSARYILESDHKNRFIVLTNEIDEYVRSRDFLLVKTRIHALFTLVFPV